MHLIEAAVAYNQATGKSKMLEIMRRYVDHIATVFFPAKGQKHGYPGHQEIELALVKLYRLTGDQVLLRLPMPVERIEAHPYVAEDRGRLALQRGPVVYCLEEIDNGPSLDSLQLPPEPQFTVRYQPDLLDGSAVIQGELRRRLTRGWEGQLYQPAGNTQEESVAFTAIPYALWANRGMAEMLVWLRT